MVGTVANLARITALTFVRLNLLEFSISFDRLRRSARRNVNEADCDDCALIIPGINNITTTAIILYFAFSIALPAQK